MKFTLLTIAALLAAFFVSLYKKQSFIKIAGFAAPYIILGQAIGRWGNFFNQEAFGTNTTMPNDSSIQNSSPGSGVSKLIRLVFNVLRC